MNCCRRQQFVDAAADQIIPRSQVGSTALLHFEIAGLTNLLIFIGLSVAIFAALLFLAELIYFKGVVGFLNQVPAVMWSEDDPRLVKAIGASSHVE